MRISPSASSCSSSSSSCVGSDSGINTKNNNLSAPHRPQSEKTRAKRRRRNQDESKCEIHNHNSNGINNNNVSSPRRSSIYRGVTRHRWTGRFEAHLWDKSSWNNIQNKKGRQVYLGAYDNDDAAARTYDLAALKYWGPGTTLNFPVESYTNEMEEMRKVTKEEYLASLRRRSSGFSRGVSKYRGVARHHHNGRWEARIGRVFGSKYLYLGTYNTQEEAAAAYDMAAIEYRGANAVTNFDISNYIGRLENKSSVFQAAEQPEVEPNYSPASSEGEVVQQQQQQQQTTFSGSSGLQFSSMLSSIENNPAMGVMEEPTQDDHDLHWSFLDTGFVEVPDLPLEKSSELADLYFDEIFEDDIGLIFEASLENKSIEGNSNEDDNVEKMEMNNEKMRLLSTTSPSSSSIITTSVSCEFRV